MPTNRKVSTLTTAAPAAGDFFYLVKSDGSGGFLPRKTAADNFSVLRLLAGDGTALLPSMSFASDPDTGFYRTGTNQIGVSANGAIRWNFTGGGTLISTGGVLQSGDGSVSAPGLTFANDTDNGLYRIGADNVGIAAGANKILEAAYSGGAPRLGFFGTAHQPKPAITGSRGGNAALASLLTALATLGLLTDSTSA